MKVKVQMGWLVDDFSTRYDRFHRGGERVECEARLAEDGNYLVVKIPDLEFHTGHFQLISASTKEKTELKKRGLIK